MGAAVADAGGPRGLPREQVQHEHVHGVVSDGHARVPARFPGGGRRPRAVRGGVAQEVAGRGPVGGG
eukprot:67560-Prorocentrum_minimum.AAC.1